MAIPFAPIAAAVFKYGSVVLAGYAIARATSPGRLDQHVEDVMDNTAEGITVKSEDDQINATFRWVRSFRLNPTGRGLSIDATALTRLKVRRLT